MAMSAHASTRVGASPQTVLEFVLDLERYKEVDKKIVKVLGTDGPDSDGRGWVKMLGRVRGMPPAPDKQDFVLDRWRHLTFTGAARQPARMIFDFTGTFDCSVESDGTTLVTHSYRFNFKGPFLLAERWLADWLQAEVEAEMQALSKRLSSSPGAT